MHFATGQTHFAMRKIQIGSRVRLTFHNRVISHQVLIERAGTAFDETSIVTSLQFANSFQKPLNISLVIKEIFPGGLNIWQ